MVFLFTQLETTQFVAYVNVQLSFAKIQACFHGSKSRATNEEWVIALKNIGSNIEVVKLSFDFTGRPGYYLSKVRFDRCSMCTEAVHRRKSWTFFDFGDIKCGHHIAQSRFCDDRVHCT
jgi:hypothetical protein